MLRKSVVCFIFVRNVVLFVLFLAVLLTNKDNKKSICPLLAVCLSFERDIRGSFSSGGIAVSGPMADASGRAAEFVGQAACGMKNRHAAHCAACRFCRSWRIGYLKKIEEISL